MSQTILILSTSLRKGGNSDALANEFFRGAKDAGHRVEKVRLSDKTIRFCTGCLACNRTHRCVIHDDADKIAQKMRAADVLVFATPIYYYEMCGQMKTMLDRANPLYGSDYRFGDIYLLSTAAEDGDDVPRRAENGLQGWIDCFPKARLTGTVFAGGVDAPGSIQGHPALKKAYEMGRAVSARKE
ncbi:MAG: flavodoxin family protein [Clostridiales bacterium]|nr:flavodoxin family protein [Clostridiales bacterium]